MMVDDERFQVPPDIRAFQKQLDDTQRPVIHNLAEGRGWGYGRIIQLCHQLWDELMEREHGIKDHSRDFQLASAEVILEAEAKKHPEHSKEFLRLAKALSSARKKMI